MTYKEWNIEKITGYKPITTYYMDFGIAEPFGENAIRDTYKTAIKEHIKNIEILTEIYMVLNWKIWEHYDNGNEKLSTLYDKLWKECGEFIENNAEKYNYDMKYFYRTTD